MRSSKSSNLFHHHHHHHQVVIYQICQAQPRRRVPSHLHPSWEDVHIDGLLTYMAD